LTLRTSLFLPYSHRLPRSKSSCGRLREFLATRLISRR
jgi:hypothetical protein